MRAPQVKHLMGMIISLTHFSGPEVVNSFYARVLSKDNSEAYAEDEFESGALVYSLG